MFLLNVVLKKIHYAIRNLEEQCAAPSVHGTVCLTHTGDFKQEGDSWKTSVQNATDRCLYCSCKVKSKRERECEREIKRDRER